MPSIRAKLFLTLLKNRHLLRLKRHPETGADWEHDLPGVRARAQKAAAMLSKPPKDMDLWRVMIGGLPAEWILPKQTGEGQDGCLSSPASVNTTTSAPTRTSTSTAATSVDTATPPRSTTDSIPASDASSATTATSSATTTTVDNAQPQSRTTDHDSPSGATGPSLPQGLDKDDLTRRGVVLYFRGGGYVMGAIEPHRGIVAKFIRSSGVPTLLFEYRNSPEHPYPAALNAALAAYEYLLACGIPPSAIVFAGDSAGGGLLLATLLHLKDHAHPLPAAAVSLSPFTDLLCTGESLTTNAATCISPTGSWLVCARNYAGDHNASSPYISPLYGDLTGLPPLYVCAGGHEALLDDSVRFARKAAESGVDVTLNVGEGMCHCYPACAPLFPEATAELANLGQFIRKFAGNG